MDMVAIFKDSNIAIVLNWMCVPPFFLSNPISNPKFKKRRWCHLLQWIEFTIPWIKPIKTYEWQPNRDF